MTSSTQTPLSLHLNLHEPFAMAWQTLLRAARDRSRAVKPLHKHEGKELTGGGIKLGHRRALSPGGCELPSTQPVPVVLGGGDSSVEIAANHQESSTVRC